MKIPDEVKMIMKILYDEGFEAFVVGGCVRDSLMNKNPEDWDLATNAEPEKVQTLFKKKGFNCFYENDFGTVGVVLPDNPQRGFSNIIEITTYRTESAYSDNRRPDSVRWAKTIEEDLSRRDFTSNAIAVRVDKDKVEIIDPYGGREDIKKKIIRAVCDPEKRFNEDALRIFRAVRFATTLNFKIELETLKAIKKNASWIANISKERVRDELIKIIMSERAADGIELLRSTGILKYVIPELIDGYGVAQNKHHIYDCYWHNLLTLNYAAKKGFNLHVRMAGLLHDVAKPAVKRGEGDNATFYNHEIVGAKMTRDILYRLKFSKKDIIKIVKLVRYHLFYYNVGEVSETSIRRLIRQVGKENMDDLLKLRMSDRVGSGVPKAEPYKLRHLKYLIDKVSQDPISVNLLAVGGKDVMEILGQGPGPKVGWILNILLQQVLADPKKNKKEYLKKEITRLGSLSDGDLRSLNNSAKKEIEKIEIKKDEMTKKKYWVS